LHTTRISSGVRFEQIIQCRRVSLEQFLRHPVGGQGLDDAVLTARPAEQVNLPTPLTAEGKESTSGPFNFRDRLITNGACRSAAHQRLKQD
jgi:hypothetical protein